MDQKTRDILEIIASKPYETCETTWREALRLLRLGVSYIPAVQAILKQERWRQQPNPVAYLRKAALWCAIRMGLVDLPHQNAREVLAADLNFTDVDGEPIPHDEKLDWALTNYEERFGSYYNEGYEHAPSDRVSDALLKDSDQVDWERAAELAGLDRGERITLEIQLMGIGREQALSICHRDEDRRFLQAAWKRFDRHKGALKETLLSGSSRQSRRIKRHSMEKEMELVFVETADGSLRISFQELVPEEAI